MAGRFLLANANGVHVEGQYIDLALGAEYLWVSDQLSIPLAAITEISDTKRGGRIVYYDSIADQQLELNFTKVGFMRYKKKHVVEFLVAAKACVESLPKTLLEQDLSESALGLNQLTVAHCEFCDSQECHPYVFYVYKFVGVALIAYSGSLEPSRRVLCPQHARRESLACSLRTALLGYWGIPGCVAAAWYVARNIWALSSTQSLTVGHFLAAVSVGILLPYTALGTLLAAIYYGWARQYLT